MNEKIEELQNKLGRLPAPDSRDETHLIKALLPKKITRTDKSWYDSKYFLDQGSTSSCVGHGWSHWFLDGPVTHKKSTIDPFNIYTEAQKIDEWPGEQYDGTSVRAGAKVLQSMGIITEYRWAWDIDTLVDAVLTKGPVVVGTNWYYDMFNPNKKGLLYVSGGIAGGHCYIINGVNTKTKLLRIKNSWGKGWSKKGRAFISFDNMARLIAEEGEVALAIEKP